MADQSTPLGQQRPTDQIGEYNRQRFVIDQALRRVQTAMLVKVLAVTNAGGVSPVGFVDILPLVNQIDGAGNPVPHIAIHNVPYNRLQGGANAVIIDPVVGDIGMAAFASRDITKVKKTRRQANPGSLRTHNWADGMYFGGFLNAAPSQYIQFSAAGITIHSLAAVNVVAPIINLGATGQSLRAFVTSAFQALFNSHTHPGDSGGTTGAPNQQMGAGELTTTVKGG